MLHNSMTRFGDKQFLFQSPGRNIKSCSAIVAVPVQNEDQYIADCLSALVSQLASCSYGVVLLLNNCTDDTLIVVQKLAPHLPMPVLVAEVTLPAKVAHAGYARHLAMRYAAEIAPRNAILLTTDADAQVYPDWIVANLAAIRAGAEVVAGRAELDPTDAGRIPARLHEDDARECGYDQLLDQIHARLDPDGADPWPRHTEHSGASIAVTLDAYHRAGGIPAVPVGEDRAFIAALRRVDARIRHAPEVRVVVSGRTVGRAVGGMADTIRRRLKKADETLDERLEPACGAALRAWTRGLLRALWGSEELVDAIKLLATRSQVCQSEIKRLLRSSYFGEAWAQLEAHSPALRRQRVLTRNLPIEMEHALRILDSLGCGPVWTESTSRDPSDTSDFGGAVSA
jgi:hypothetical protein